MHEKAPPHLKRTYLSITHGALTLKDLKRLGFKLSPQSFATANRHAREVGVGMPLPTQTPQSKKKEK